MCKGEIYWFPHNKTLSTGTMVHMLIPCTGICHSHGLDTACLTKNAKRRDVRCRVSFDISQEYRPSRTITQAISRASTSLISWVLQPLKLGLELENKKAKCCPLDTIKKHGLRIGQIIVCHRRGLVVSDNGYHSMVWGFNPQ